MFKSFSFILWITNYTKYFKYILRQYYTNVSFQKQSLPKKADDNKIITKEKEIAKVVRNQQINKINLLNELRERTF